MSDTAPQEQQPGSSASALAAARPSLEQREFAVKVMRAYLRDMADDGNLTDAQSVTLMQAVGMFDQLLPLLAEQEAARRESDDSARLIDFTRYLAERFPVSCAFLRFDGGQSVVRDFNAARTAPGGANAATR